MNYKYDRNNIRFVKYRLEIILVVGLKEKLMNEWVSIIKNINKSIARIVLYSEGEIVSEGTGTIINSSGIVLTAWHVVETCNYFISEKKDYSLFVFTSEGRFLYNLCSSQFFIGIPLLEKEKLELEIDLALLEPLLPIKFEHYLSPVLSNIEIEMGADLLMCGYSEETPSFMDFRSIAAKMFKGQLTDELKKEMKLNEGSLKPPTYKSGILAHTTHVYVENPSLHYQQLHIDNGAHGGMSGGPVVDSEGRFIAVLVQRTIVRSNVMAEGTLLKFEVPSGNSIAITLNFLEHIFYKSNFRL